MSMLTIIGFVLGIIWFIFLCIIIMLLIIKVINKFKHKKESLVFQKIFNFLLNSIIPFFIVLFFIGGCSTIFANPKVYYCIAYEIINNKLGTCGFTNYGIFIFGNEGSGRIKIYFKEER